MRIRDLALDDLLDFAHYALRSRFDSIVHLAGEEHELHVRELDLVLTEGTPEETDAPAWWHGDEEATESGLLAARSLGLNLN